MAKKPTYDELERRILDLEAALGSQTTSNESQITSEKRYSAIIHKIAAAIVVHDADTKVLDCNAKAQELLGVSKERMLGRQASDPAWRFLSEENETMPHEAYPVVRVLTTKQPLRDLIVGILRADQNDLVWVLINADPVLDSMGEIQQVIVTFMDITAHKKAQEAHLASESKFRSVVDSTPMGMHMYQLESDERLVFVGANPAADKILDLDNTQFIGKTIEEAFPSLAETEAPNRYRRVAADGVPWQTQQLTYAVGNKAGVFEVNAFQTGNGKMVAMFVEISDQKRAEQAIIESETMYRQVVNTISDGLGIVDKRGVIKFASASLCEKYGYTEQELVGMQAIQLVHPDYHHVFEQYLIRLSETGRFTGQTIDVRKDGSTLHTDVRGARILYKGQECFLAIIRDVTDQWNAEETMRRYEHIISSTEDMMSFVDRNYVYRAVNNAYLTMHQKKREEIVGFSIEQLMGSQAFHKVVKQNLDRALAGKTVHYQSWFNYPVIGRRYMDVTYHPFIDKSGKINGIVVGVHDMTEIKQAEEDLRHSEEKFRDLVENINDVIFSTDEKGQLTYISPLIESWTAYDREEIIGKSFEKFIHPDDVATVKLSFHQRLADVAGSGEYRIVTKSGEAIWVRSSSLPIYMGDHVVGLRGVLTDISEKKRLESQLMQAQKMKAVGTLAGGIAHDFNNLLMGIQGNASLMLMDLDSHDPNYERLKNVGQLVQSGAELTKQLLGFARGGKYEVKPTDLNKIITDSTKMFGRTRKDIKIHNKFDQNLWTVEVDRRQIEQVMLNLYVNAWQAMPGGGEIYIQTENVALHNEEVRGSGTNAGKYVKISIADTGCGMDKSVQDRIFDPFFTTKEKGRGTGLGLASAYGIIKNHGGTINVYSEKERGTTFNILLPASNKTVTDDIAPQDGFAKGDETILLIDDEQLIINVGRIMLEKIGYDVVAATSGKEALQIYEKRHDRIDLVILDMIMPEMSGGDTYEKLKQINPAIKVVLASGFSIDARARKILDAGSSAFIHKPYGLMELSKKVRSILDE